MEKDDRGHNKSKDSLRLFIAVLDATGTISRVRQARKTVIFRLNSKLTHHTS